MKNTLLVIAVLLVGACAATPTVKSVAGTYEMKGKDAGRTLRYIFLENGVVEGYTKGERWKEAKWSINKEVEIHIEEKEWIEIFRINKDGSITIIGGITGGKRVDLRKEEQHTFKKSNNPPTAPPKP
jgi:hypothetical protein